MKMRAFFIVTALMTLLLTAGYAQKSDEKGFKSITDGKSFKGWKMSEENKETWSIREGAFVAHGARNHLFYVGDEKPFVNFELKVDVKTEPGSNGGIYFHTQYQPEGWPKYGYEVQVNQTQTDWRRTGSLYGVQDVREQLVKDNEWYTYHIIVKGKHITIKVNDKTTVDWDEPADLKPGGSVTRVLDKGTFALQAHDPKSVIYYRNIRVKRLD